MSDPKEIKSRKLNLNNTALRAILPGWTLYDTEVPGLQVRYTASRPAYFLYYRTQAGDERRPKLGDTKIIPLAQAREQARTMLAAVAEGRDPTAERAKLRAEPTMDELWAVVEAKVYNRGKDWDREAKRLYTQHAAPRMGKVRVSLVDVDHVGDMHAAMKDTPVEANHAVAVVSKMLSYAEQPGVKLRAPNSNPCKAVKRYPEKKRKRFAKPAELGKIGPILEREATVRPWRAAFVYLLLYSGARPSEIEFALPSQLERVDVKDVGLCGVLRLPEGKNGEPRDVFLPPQAMLVIDKLPRAGRPLLDRHRRVLATTITGIRMPRKLWEIVRVEAGCPDLWARDSRRTFATVGFSGGEDKHVVSGLLGHASIQTTNIYALLMEDPAFASAARIATRMEGLLTSAPPALAIAAPSSDR